MRLLPTQCRVCFRPCVFNKFSHFWQKMAHLGRFDCNDDAVPPIEDIEDDRSGLARAQALLAW